MSKRTKKGFSSRTLTFRIILGFFALFVVTAALSFSVVVSFEKYYPLDDEDSLLLFALVVLGISVILGVGLSVLYTRLLINSTAPYVKALQKVRDCDFTVRVKETALFGDLKIADNFNNMVEQLASVETLRESFVSDFSHEFKTPIVSIEGFAKLLKDPNLSAEERNEYLDVILSESKRLVELSESVLMLTRLDSHKVVLEKYRLDEQLRQCVLLFDQSATEQGIELDLDLEEEIVVNGAINLNKQIWVNLLSNALKFTPTGGKISLSAHITNGRPTVVISDNGCGMDEETQKNIFNKFYQGDASRTTPGNGLGLSIVKKILDITQGQIYVDSIVGKGSTFTVVLKN
ncbi:MAG: HAMP domain-containing histidine kinase [Clostridia bacterium]|nr:HAMP domain-containing histidine kinase [Clostridia bacterium]